MEILENLPDSDLRITFLFAHGAGAPMDSEFMQEVAELFSERGIKVIRFEFPYMQERRATGKKRPPDRAPKLLDCFRSVLADVQVDNERIFVGGKSMGGRMASLLTSDSSLYIKGCVCFGYPYHAPGKPEKVRNEHFVEAVSPILILQGERDAFGTKQEIESYDAFAKVEHKWLVDGNHDLKPRKASGMTHRENLIQAVDMAVEWMKNTV